MRMSFLGLFPTRYPEKADMVVLGPGNKVVDIVIKQNGCNLTYAWVIAVWSFRFTHFLHNFVTSHHTSIKQNHHMESNGSDKELFLGTVIRAAIDEKMKIDAVILEEGFFFDIGTQNELNEAIHYYSGPRHSTLPHAL